MNDSANIEPVDFVVVCEFCLWDDGNRRTTHQQWVDGLLRVQIEDGLLIQVVDGTGAKVIVGDDANEWTRGLVAHREWLLSNT